MWCPMLSIPYASRLWLHERLGWSASGEARLARGNPTHIESCCCCGPLVGSSRRLSTYGALVHFRLREEKKAAMRASEEGLAYTDLFYGRLVRPFTKEHVRVQLSLTRTPATVDLRLNVSGSLSISRERCRVTVT
jgi:hypothetical protein